ncbi:galactokinase [Aureococcus anophagefferens]|nr:galactokinase [Aureococcus anophagefferens]
MAAFRPKLSRAPSIWADTDENVAGRLKDYAEAAGLDIAGGTVRRTSSRFCLGVEHGDYNGTALFGVGTDRYIWVAYKPNASGRCRLYSANFEAAGVVDFASGEQPKPRPRGVVGAGFDAVVWGNIPGGGMSRSASLCLNLIGVFLDVNGAKPRETGGLAAAVTLAVAVENDYVGSPCGNLDQIMIHYAKAGFGTYYDPATDAIDYVPLGEDHEDYAIVALDTGTDRPGLDKSTYKVRRAQCDGFAKELFTSNFIATPKLGAVKDDAVYDQVRAAYASGAFQQHFKCFDYIYRAQRRFDAMMDARPGLRDDYAISGPELETMCDIARTVDGVYGERMLGGGDKGAAGAIVAAAAVDALVSAVRRAYPKAHPAYKDKFATHVVHPCDGVAVLPGLL